MLLGKDGEHRTECRMLQFQFLIEQLRQKVDLVLVSLKGPSKLESNTICMFLGKDGEQRTEWRKVLSKRQTSVLQASFSFQNLKKASCASTWFLKERDNKKE